MKLTDLLPLKWFILGDTEKRMPTKNAGEKIPTINRYGCNLSTSFDFPLARSSKMKAIIAELILDAYTPVNNNVNCRYWDHILEKSNV